jgi:hypothetical protein
MRQAAHYRSLGRPKTETKIAYAIHTPKNACVILPARAKPGASKASEYLGSAPRDPNISFESLVVVLLTERYWPGSGQICLTAVSQCIGVYGLGV